MISDLDLNNHFIDNLKAVQSGHQAVNFTQLNNELSNYLHLTGGTMKGDFQCNNNSIYGIKNSIDKTSAVNREYVSDKFKNNLDKNKDINMGGNKIVSYRSPNDLNKLVNKSYVDQKVSQAGGSVDLSPYLKNNGSVVMTNDLNLNNNKLFNAKNATVNLDAVNLQQLNEANSLLANTVSKLYLKKDGTTLLAGNINLNNHSGKFGHTY